MNEIIEGVDVIVGMDDISQLGEVTIYENGAVEFRGVHCAVSTQTRAMTQENSGISLCKIKDKDFSVSFDGERWTIEWN